MKKIAITTVFTLLSVLSMNAQNGLRMRNRSSSITGDLNFKIFHPNDTTTENVYKTSDIIQYNYLTVQEKKIEFKYDSINNDLYENSKDTIVSEIFDTTYVKEQLKTMEKLRNKLSIMKLKQDTLYFSYIKDLLNHNTSNFIFGTIKSKAFFDIIYDGKGEYFKTLGNTGFSFGSNSASIYAELVSGNLGIFRVSLGSMITSSSDSLQNGKKDEAYQKLVTNGGNTVLNIEYPLMFLHSRDNYYNLISRLIVRGTSDLPAFGTSTQKFAGSASLGIDFYGDASLSNNQLRFFANFNANKIFGTDVFRDNLGIKNNNFTFGQLSLGLVFLQAFKISFTVFTVSSEASLRNKNVVGGGQILR